ncbi:MAG: hypothetical protein IKO27_01930 [Ruminococcus sp.]|nr:hypothetical protein [Ruminococcus sp.]
MQKNDTIELLRETNSGIKMGIDSIDELLPKVKSERFRHILEECRSTHQRLGTRSHKLLSEYGEETAGPNPIAKGMSWLKTNIKMAAEPTDPTAADLITDGCNMGVKSLNGYINKCRDADPEAVSLAKQLIRSEEKLCADVREFLR